MKIFYMFLFNLILLCCAAQIKKADNKWCHAFIIEKITIGIDTDKVHVFHDTINTLYITVLNVCENCKIEGPDYCLLTVTNFQNDTLGCVAINGVPQKFNEKRTYPAFARSKWKKNPDLKKLIISLPPYCDHLKFQKK